ncbi:hypothetical protein PP940_gp162 [Rhizobium phage RL2RES]|uniref:Uncharacterized protein n=1 Tax=Rhizobium phage RL2RES TaxID=103371 RepID=A0A6B9J4G3_9CAUD|nr:hypothetical protein PP940_gp162 [Rhizobium phage RL2RES]QGZ14338.1 hypothetical protein RL2RES_162 [Rhizobium phage RL2RES]
MKITEVSIEEAYDFVSALGAAEGMIDEVIAVNLKDQPAWMVKIFEDRKQTLIKLRDMIIEAHNQKL